MRAISPWCVVMKSISSCAGAPYFALRSSWHDNNLSICARNKGGWEQAINQEDGSDGSEKELPGYHTLVGGSIVRSVTGHGNFTRGT